MSLPEPPDGTRLEFEYGSDVYAIWREDESSRRAGYPIGDGGETWVEYGSSMPVTWAKMIERYSEESLRLAVRLVPIVDDLPNRAQWPTEVYYRENRDAVEATLACVHCGRTPAAGYATVGDWDRVCHPPMKPSDEMPDGGELDCYRLVTVYHETIGARREFPVQRRFR